MGVATEVASIFRVHRVAEIREIESRVRASADDKGIALQEMLGTRYRELIRASNDVCLLHENSNAVKTGIHHIQQAAGEVRHSLLDKAASADAQSQQHKAAAEQLEQRRVVHVIGSHLKYLVDTPEQLYACLDSFRLYEATVRVSHAHAAVRTLRQEPIAHSAHTFIEAQWRTVEAFRDPILSGAHHVLKSDDFHNREYIGALAAIVLIRAHESSKSDHAIVDPIPYLLDSRSQRLESQSHRFLKLLGDTLKASTSDASTQAQNSWLEKSSLEASVEQLAIDYLLEVTKVIRKSVELVDAAFIPEDEGTKRTGFSPLIASIPLTEANTGPLFTPKASMTASRNQTSDRSNTLLVMGEKSLLINMILNVDFQLGNRILDSKLISVERSKQLMVKWLESCAQVVAVALKQFLQHIRRVSTLSKLLQSLTLELEVDLLPEDLAFVRSNSTSAPAASLAPRGFSSEKHLSRTVSTPSPRMNTNMDMSPDLPRSSKSVRGSAVYHSPSFKASSKMAAAIPDFSKSVVSLLGESGKQEILELVFYGPILERSAEIAKAHVVYAVTCFEVYVKKGWSQIAAIPEISALYFMADEFSGDGNLGDLLWSRSSLLPSLGELGKRKGVVAAASGPDDKQSSGGRTTEYGSTSVTALVDVEAELGKIGLASKIGSELESLLNNARQDLSSMDHLPSPSRKAFRDAISKELPTLLDLLASLIKEADSTLKLSKRSNTVPVGGGEGVRPDVMIEKLLFAARLVLALEDSTVVSESFLYGLEVDANILTNPTATSTVKKQEAVYEKYLEDFFSRAEELGETAFEIWARWIAARSAQRYEILTSRSPLLFERVGWNHADESAESPSSMVSHPAQCSHFLLQFVMDGCSAVSHAGGFALPLYALDSLIVHMLNEFSSSCLKIADECIGPAFTSATRREDRNRAENAGTQMIFDIAFLCGMILGESKKKESDLYSWIFREQSVLVDFTQHLDKVESTITSRLDPINWTLVSDHIYSTAFVQIPKYHVLAGLLMRSSFMSKKMAAEHSWRNMEPGLSAPAGASASLLSLASTASRLSYLPAPTPSIYNVSAASAAAGSSATSRIQLFSQKLDDGNVSISDLVSRGSAEAALLAATAALNLSESDKETSGLAALASRIKDSAAGGAGGISSATSSSTSSLLSDAGFATGLGSWGKMSSSLFESFKAKTVGQ